MYNWFVYMLNTLTLLGVGFEILNAAEEKGDWN